MPANGAWHTVKEGDTLETLERLHGTSPQEILEHFGTGFLSFQNQMVYLSDCKVFPIDLSHCHLTMLRQVALSYSFFYDDFGPSRPLHSHIARIIQNLWKTPAKYPFRIFRARVYTSAGRWFPVIIVPVC